LTVKISSSVKLTNTVGQETELLGDDISAVLDTSQSCSPEKEREITVAVPETAYSSQTAIRPMDDVEVALEILEPLEAKQKIRERSEVITALLGDINGINVFSGFDQRLPDAIFLKSDDETFFTGKSHTSDPC